MASGSLLQGQPWDWHCWSVLWQGRELL